MGSMYFNTFSGEILRNNDTCAIIEDDEVVHVYNNAPIYIKRTHSFIGWLEMRSADFNRSYMRAIARALKLPMHGGADVVKEVNAVCVTDTFWIRKHGSRNTYSDISFKQNDFFKAALQGDASIFSSDINKNTPELTNIGSFNKGWRLVNNEWVLYKAGNPLQYFSELFTSRLGKALKLDMVEYYMDSGFIACKNFVPENQCYEPAKAIIGENIDYIFNLEQLAKYETSPLTNQYLDILFLDTVVFNVDRHELNYGVNTESEQIVKMAPNFDNNLALFGYDLPKTFLRTNDILIMEFAAAVGSVKNYSVPNITEALVKDCINETMQDIAVSVSAQNVYDYIMSSYECIIKSFGV